jgi:hypothetical protein
MRYKLEAEVLSSHKGSERALESRITAHCVSSSD